MRILIKNKQLNKKIRIFFLIGITLNSFDSFSQTNSNNYIQYVNNNEIHINNEKAYLIKSNNLFSGIALDDKKGFQITYQNGEKVKFETFNSDKRRKLILRFKDGKLEGKSAKQIFEKNNLIANYTYKDGKLIDSIVKKINPYFQELYIHTNISPYKHLYRKQLDSIQSINLCVYEKVGGTISISKNIKIIKFKWGFGCIGLDLEIQENNCYFNQFRWEMFRNNLTCRGIEIYDILLEDENGIQWIDNGFGFAFE